MADWPQFNVILKNYDTHERLSKQADTRGNVRVKVGAEEGDTIAVYGLDSHTGRYLLEKRIFSIINGKAILLQTIHPVRKRERTQKTLRLPGRSPFHTPFW